MKKKRKSCRKFIAALLKLLYTSLRSHFQMKKRLSKLQKNQQKFYWFWPNILRQGCQNCILRAQQNLMVFFSRKLSSLLGHEITVFIFLLKIFQNVRQDCDLCREQQGTQFFLKNSDVFSDFERKVFRLWGSFFRQDCQNSLWGTRGAFWCLKKKNMNMLSTKW